MEYEEEREEGTEEGEGGGEGGAYLGTFEYYRGKNECKERECRGEEMPRSRIGVQGTGEEAGLGCKAPVESHSTAVSPMNLKERFGRHGMAKSHGPQPTEDSHCGGGQIRWDAACNRLMVGPLRTPT